MPVTRRLAAATTAALAASLIAAVAAFAGGNTFQTQVGIAESAPAFHGKVQSPNDLCVAGREVKLFRVRANGERKRVGTTNAEPNGRWDVDAEPLRSGRYFAKAPQRNVNLGKCRGDRSRSLFVD